MKKEEILKLIENKELIGVDLSGQRLEKIDFTSARFYIREESADRAMFITERYVTSVPRTIVSCVFVAIICVCVIACMPEILRLINDLLKNV